MSESTRRQICCLKDSSSGGPVTVVKAPLYEYRYIWAEENGATNANSAEWSFGNGAVGYIGLPIEEGWELVELGLHADTYAATATLRVDAMSYPLIAPGSAAANTIASIEITGATDGGGTTNNAYKLIQVSPTPVPKCIFGFITRTRVGNSSDVRVVAKLRKQIGEYVSDVY